MSGQRTRHSSARRRGFTIIELLMVTVLGSVVILGSYQLLISQSRLLTQQRETIDARDSTRGGAALLTWELKGVAASGNDLYVITADSVVLRSYQASGVICSTYTLAGVNPTSAFGLRLTSGLFTATSDDSVLAYSVENSSWAVHGVTSALNGSDAWSVTPVCFWGDSTTSAPRPEASISIDTLASLVGLEIGGPVHVFRRTTYGLSQNDGRWWLSRRVGSGAWEILTGPTLSPTDGGLTFTYYDAADAVTTDPTLVARVQFTLRAESFGQASGSLGPVQDSVTTTVFLRNND